MLALLFSLLLVVSPAFASPVGAETAGPPCIPGEPEYLPLLYESEETEYPDEPYLSEEPSCPEEWSCLEEPVTPDESGVMYATASRVGAWSAQPVAALRTMGSERVYCVETGKSYSTIMGAHDDVSTLDGYNILLDPGVYTGTVRLTKRLTITGNDTGGSWPVVQVEDSDAIVVLAAGCTLQRLVLHGVCTQPEEDPGFTGIAVHGNGCIARDIEIEGFHQGVMVTGVTNITLSNLTIPNSVFSKNHYYSVLCVASDALKIDNVSIYGADNGVSISNCRNVDLSGLEIANAVQYGLYIKDTSDVICTGLRSSGNGNNGVFLTSSETVTITNLSVEGNSNHGMFVGDSADVRITCSRFEKNRNYGIFAEDTEGFTLSNSTCTGNGNDGIHMLSAQHPGFSQVIASGNGKRGIAMVSSVQATCDNLSATGNLRSGLALWNATGTRITASKLDENGNYGIYAKDTEGFTLSDSTCTGNGNEGIYMLSPQHPGFSQVIASGNGNCGITMFSSVQATCDNLSATGNLRSGLGLWNATGTRITASKLDENGNYGIYAKDTEGFTLSDSTCTGNGNDGIHMLSSQHPKFSQVIASGNGKRGIAMVNSVQATCDNLSATGNLYSGLALWNATGARITASKLDENGNYGIYAEGTEGFTLSDSTCTGNGNAGIQMWSAQQPVISQVIASGNGKRGIGMVNSVQATFDNLSATGNLYSGLALWNATGARITASKLDENGNYGIYAEGTEGFTLSDSTCTGNGINGIAMWSAQQPVISQVIASGNGNDGIGMYPSNLSSCDNLVCDNLTCRDNFDAGIWVQNCTQFRAEDSVFEHNGRYGIYLLGCKYADITRNYITGNNVRHVEEGTGLNLSDSDDSAVIRVWNNVFDNFVNVRLINVPVPVNFSVEAVPGPSIAGGPLLGGNYWHQPDGNGWSQTHPDNDGDGFCDEAWHIDGSTWDLLPLNMAGPGPVPDFTAEPLNGSAPLEVRFTDLTCGDVKAWNWSFGDGSWFNTTDPTLSGPVHTYTRAGLFMVSLVTENSNYTLTKEKVGYISVAMVTNFTAEPTGGPAPLEVQFTDLSLGEPMCWNWSFGDGTWFNTTLPSERNATHTYTRAGNFTVRLYADNGAAQDCEEKAEYILIPMAADFYAEPLNGTPPLVVQFTDLSLGEPMCWNWSFGDGTWFNTTLPSERNATHTYTRAGNFTVRLYADNGAARDCEEKAEYILIPMSAFFSASRRSGYAPLEVAFTDQSTGTPVNWTWDFGDGATSDEQNPVHTYATPGRYHVKLTVKSVYGAAATTTRDNWITVYPPGSGGGGGDNFVKARLEDDGGSTPVVNATAVPPVSNPTQPSPVSTPSGIRETLTLLPSGGADRIPSVYIAGGLLFLVLIAALALAFLKK